MRDHLSYLLPRSPQSEFILACQFRGHSSRARSHVPPKRIGISQWGTLDLGESGPLSRHDQDHMAYPVCGLGVLGEGAWL